MQDNHIIVHNGQTISDNFMEIGSTEQMIMVEEIDKDQIIFTETMKMNLLEDLEIDLN